MRTMRISVFCSLLLSLAACGGSAKVSGTTAAANGSQNAQGLSGAAPATSTHCAATDNQHEVSEYDTSGDGRPDVRKVFLKVGADTLARLVLVCRESDVNGDGVKDVVRYYTEEGRPLREEADADLDGRMDSVTFYQEGAVIRQEIDTQGDGKVDTKIFFDAGKALRAERDLTGKSTADKWVPDRWEYYEDGHTVRMGTDLDGDGKVDRWDRDMNLRRGPNVEENSAADSSDA